MITIHINPIMDKNMYKGNDIQQGRIESFVDTSTPKYI